MATATLRLTRRWGGWVYGSRPFEISLDGKVVGSISNDQTAELPVEPGRHTLQMGAGRHISPVRSFDVDDGETVSFWCRGQMLCPLYFAALIKPDLWITLKQD